MANRRKMQIGDWFNGAGLLAVGVFLGLAVANMVQLIGTIFWPVIIVIPVLFGGFFLLVLLLDGLVDRIFGSGIKPAPNSKAKQRRPLTLLFCLPLGVVIGVIGAQFGLDNILL